jgi:hypothetical protein
LGGLWGLPIVINAPSQHLRGVWGGLSGPPIVIPYSLNIAIAVPPLVTVTLFDLVGPDEGEHVTE